MAEDTMQLELPEPEKRKKGGWGRTLGVLFGLGLLGCAAAYGAWMYYSIHTPSAVIESASLMLGAHVSAQVAEVLVKENEQVRAGQELIRFNARAGMADAAESRAQVASVRNLLPPPSGMEDVAQRVAAAQAAEQDVVQRIMQARALEEEAARGVQRKAEEHVRAQLELRRLDALSTRYSVPRALHDQARSAEYSARQALTQARAVREEHSRVRAATEGELHRMKTELSDLKNAHRHSMPDFAQPDATLPQRVSSAPAEASDTIVAPMDAVVTGVFAQPGRWVRPQQELITLMPDDGRLEATAWFPEKDGAAIQPGQLCRVFILALPGKSFFGKVAQVLPAGSMPAKFPLAAPAQSGQIPVRIRFAANDADSRAELKSGMRAAVRVHTFIPPWTLLDRFYTTAVWR